jgi:hypothetical protein
MSDDLGSPPEDTRWLEQLLQHGSADADVPILRASPMGALRLDFSTLAELFPGAVAAAQARGIPLSCQGGEPEGLFDQADSAVQVLYRLSRGVSPGAPGESGNARAYQVLAAFAVRGLLAHWAERPPEDGAPRMPGPLPPPSPEARSQGSPPTG